VLFGAGEGQEHGLEKARHEKADISRISRPCPTKNAIKYMTKNLISVPSTLLFPASPGNKLILRKNAISGK